MLRVLPGLFFVVNEKIRSIIVIQNSIHSLIAVFDIEADILTGQDSHFVKWQLNRLAKKLM